MRYKHLLHCFLIALSCAASAARADSALHYRVNVRIEPAGHALQADVRISNPLATRFYLYKGFSVQRVIADGKPVPFHIDPSAKPLPYSPAAFAVVVDAPSARELRVRYGGVMPDVIAGVNMIGPSLVELALYSSWFPQFEGSREYTFALEADLPSEFTAVTNGRQDTSRAGKGRRVTRASSFRPTFDIVLLASPRLKTLAGGPDDTRVELIHDRLPPQILQSKMNNLVAGMRRLTEFYGAPRVKGILRFAYSPRSGWGYARIPLFVVSEERALGMLQSDRGDAKDFRDNAHEMAHFWWMISDPGTTHDWLNEGLAEFSAFRLAEERFGKVFAEALMAEYRQNATRNKTNASIAETESSSPDREINRYARAALMLIEARRLFGAASLDRFLQSLHLQYAGTGRATTAVFLDAARAYMGAQAEGFFRDELYRRPAAKKGSA